MNRLLSSFLGLLGRQVLKPQIMVIKSQTGVPTLCDLEQSHEQEIRMFKTGF